MNRAWNGAGWELHNTDVLAWAEGYKGERFDALITDPPYSSGGAMRSDRNQRTAVKYVNSDSGNRTLTDFAGDNRDQRSFVTWCAMWLGAVWRLSKPGAVALVFCDWRQLPAMTDAVQAGGWVWRGVVPWSKTRGSSRPQKGRFRAQCEYLIFATKGAHTAYEGAPCLDGMFEVMPPRKRTHITEKPVELIRKVLPVVQPGGLVLDPFTGSGALAEACLREGRRVVALELVTPIAAQAAIRLAETLT